MDDPLDVIEFIVISDHRVAVLEALNERPRTRNELRTETGASSPTMGRILTDFGDRHWIERDGKTYRLTDLGRFVADQFDALLEAMTIENQLHDVWQWLPHDLDGFGAELLGDAVVSYPGPGYPYEPVERDKQIVEDSGTMRGFGMTMVKSNTLEPFFDRILDGLECEFIYPPEVFEVILSWDSETVSEAIARDNYTVLLHEDLPNEEWCGICLSDDRVSICCYEPETGMLRALVDTDAPRAYSWGESVYERYRAEARPLEEISEVGSVESHL